MVNRLQWISHLASNTDQKTGLLRKNDFDLISLILVEAYIQPQYSTTSINIPVI